MAANALQCRLRCQVPRVCNAMQLPSLHTCANRLSSSYRTVSRAPDHWNGGPWSADPGDEAQYCLRFLNRRANTLRAGGLGACRAAQSICAQMAVEAAAMQPGGYVPEGSPQ